MIVIHITIFPKFIKVASNLDKPDLNKSQTTKRSMGRQYT